MMASDINIYNFSMVMFIDVDTSLYSNGWDRSLAPFLSAAGGLPACLAVLREVDSAEDISHRQHP